MMMAMNEERNWFVGVDWASETRHVCLLDANGDKLGESGFPHGGVGPDWRAGITAVAKWATISAWLRSVAPGRPLVFGRGASLIPVCIDQNPWAHFLVPIEIMTHG